MTAQFRSLVKSLLVSAVVALAASAAANAATIQLRARLNGEQVPLAVPGTGLGVVSFDTATKVVTWNVSYQDLSGPCIAVHFHGPAPAGTDAGVAVGMGCNGNPLTGSAPLNATQEAQLLSGQWYINIHTGEHGGGEIRGQVVRVKWDFNGDGRADVLWRNSSSGENYLWPMDAATILPGEGYLRTVADQSWQIAGKGDFDGDGKADILWRNATTGENYVFFMNGLSIVNEGDLRTVVDQNWQVAGVGDFDGDGKDDVLWRNASSGENYVYLMNGLSIASEGYLRTVSDQNWRIAGSGDFNGDGRSDILWRNAATGENYVYLMNGTSIIGEGYLRTVSNLDWKVVGVGDFNGEGRADILWRNSSSGENYLYPMNGTAILGGEGYLRTVADAAWKVVQVGDFDGDGRADILWRNSSSGENYLWPMDAATILPGEGYLRTVTDQNWKVQYPSSQGPAPGPGTVVSLAPVADNTLYESATGDLSNGAGPTFYVGRTNSGSIRRGLLKFDLSGIPAGSTINSATLTLHVSKTGPAAAGSIALHRLLDSWGEGTSDAGELHGGNGTLATANDATWLHRFYSQTLWSTPGGDFAATASAATEVSEIDDYNWSGAGVTADVSQWRASPATNFGWLLRGNEAVNGSARQFDSKENPTTANRPRLVVNYTAP